MARMRAIENDRGVLRPLTRGIYRHYRILTGASCSRLAAMCARARHWPLMGPFTGHYLLHHAMAIGCVDLCDNRSVGAFMRPPFRTG